MQDISWEFSMISISEAILKIWQFDYTFLNDWNRFWQFERFMVITHLTKHDSEQYPHVADDFV